MAASVPASVELAFQQLARGIRAVGFPDLDLMKAPWTEIERGVARLLGGPFQVQRPEHQAIALGVAATLGKRLAEEDGGFWVPNRESPDGLIMGFPDAIIMLSPFGAAIDALSKANLGQLEELQREVRTALGRVRLSITGPAPAKLTPADYERLFDPAFIQFVVLDQNRLEEAWDQPVGQFMRNLRDALDRAGTKLPAEVRRQIEAQLVAALSALDPQQSLMAQLAKAGRLVELAAHLAATVEATPPAPEDFWAAVVFPLLFIGSPQSFPPLGDEEKQALSQGVDPLFLFLDVVPYQHTTEDEGLLGVFGNEDVGLLHPSMGGLSPIRLLSVRLDRIGPALEKFDASASRAAFERFCEYLRQQTQAKVDPAPSQPVLNEAFALLGSLKKVWEARSKGPVALRRLTEAEAASEGALAVVRNAMQGPRIILA